MSSDLESPGAVFRDARETTDSRVDYPEASVLAEIVIAVEALDDDDDRPDDDDEDGDDEPLDDERKRSARRAHVLVKKQNRAW